MRYESLRSPLASPMVFARRMAFSVSLSLILVAISLAVGMVGYHDLAGLNWIDSFLNASMILGGMGPLAELHTNGAKVFAGLYALYSGLFLILVAGLILAPALHRLLHRLHIDDKDEDADAAQA
ncbi:MAG TPA: hypothetical protein VFN88_05930 [Caulobacteraceae bacterium]|nr:hypothetical protein [Caulobacteraceae bacterium]